MATFNDLPVELAQYIWSLLKHDPAGRRHLCVAVVPVVRRHVFARVVIQTDRLEQLHSLIMSADPVLRGRAGIQNAGDSVRDLVLPDVDAVRASESDVDTATKACAAVVEILCRCRQIERLTCSDVLTTWILVSGEAASNWAKLKRLVVLHAGGMDSPLYHGYFAHLRQFSALRQLDLDLSSDAAEPFGPLGAPRPRTIGQSPIMSLRLVGGEGLATSGAALFVADLARLTNLELILCNRVDIRPLLRACPATLLRLSIEVEHDPNDGLAIEPLDVEADLRRFVHLRKLKLGACTYAPTCELFDVLYAHLPRLREVTLTRGTRLVADKVLYYVLARGGPARQLDKVVLDSIVAITEPLPSQVPDDSDVANGTLDLDMFWTPPAWTPSFTLADARALIAAAERAGVKLEGSTVRAVEYDAVLAREEKYLLGRRDEVLESVRGLFGEGEGEGEA